MPIAMIVHGGAWAIPDEQVDAHQAGCRAALEAGWQLLSQGRSALEACEAAVRIMEDDPTYDAGVGSHLTADGMVELDAAVMDGRSLRYGAVANLRRVRNPITLARHVLEGPATMLVGAGAEAFAERCGMALCENSELIVERERKLWEEWRAGQAAGAATYGAAQAESAARAVAQDTVGAIALDSSGNIVVANSTGGTPFKLPGRVGDTPMVGSGLYADALVAGAVCTGWGESITRVVLARRAVELVERGLAPQSAVELSVRTLARHVPGGNGGCVLLTHGGQIGLAWNTRRMAYAYRVEGAEPAWGV
jgi:beta-aspartyl-peptidase (threonine type)